MPMTAWYVESMRNEFCIPSHMRVGDMLCGHRQEELPASMEAEARKGHKEEMRAAHQEKTAALDKHNHGPSSTAGMRVNMQMDARRSRHGTD